jgi:hypothetical protein
MWHGAYVRPKPCHMASMLSSSHAMWDLTKVKTCNMAHMLGLGHAM